MHILLVNPCPGLMSHGLGNIRLVVGFGLQLISEGGEGGRGGGVGAGREGIKCKNMTSQHTLPCFTVLAET